MRLADIANNLPQMNKAVALVLSLRDRIAADEEKHLIAKTSDPCWKFVSNLEGLEGQVGRISVVNLRAQEKAFLSHLAAMEAVSKTPWSGVVEVATGTRTQHWQQTQEEQQLEEEGRVVQEQGGGVSKPEKG